MEEREREPLILLMQNRIVIINIPKGAELANMASRSVLENVTFVLVAKNSKCEVKTHETILLGI